MCTKVHCPVAPPKLFSIFFIFCRYDFITKIRGCPVEKYQFCMSRDGNWLFGRHFVIVYPIFDFFFFFCCILVLKIHNSCTSEEGPNQFSSTVVHTLSLSYRCGVSRLYNASRGKKKPFSLDNIAIRDSPQCMQKRNPVFYKHSSKCTGI